MSLSDDFSVEKKMIAKVRWICVEITCLYIIWTLIGKYVKHINTACYGDDDDDNGNYIFSFTILYFIPKYN